MKPTAASEQHSSGMKFNTRSWSYQTKDCPSWASSTQRQNWGAAGVVLWDDEQQQITRLRARQALDILSHLQTQDNWRQQGITVGESAVMLKIPKLPPAPRLKGEAPLPELSMEEPQHVLINAIQFSVERTQELLNLLQRYEYELRAMAEADQEAYTRAMSKVVDCILLDGEKQQAEQVDLTVRPYPWTKHLVDEMTWSCDAPPNRATVRFSKLSNKWEACVEVPHEFKNEKRFLPSFEAALKWAEDELRAAAANAATPPTPTLQPRRLSVATLPPAHRKRLKRYWIAPSDLEPAWLTYRTVIYLTHGPIRKSGLEMPFGELMYDSDAYPTAVELAQRVNLTAQAIDVELLWRGAYRITSITSYTQAQDATAQAEKLWNLLAPALRSGKIMGAIYGMEEVETMYRAWIGGYGQWPETPQNRTTFMSDCAFNLTLMHALDVDGYRAAHPVFAGRMSNEELLQLFHSQRAKSPAIPEAARAESEQWVRQHRTSTASTTHSAP